MLLNSLLKRVYKNEKNERYKRGSRSIEYLLLTLGGCIIGYKYGYRYCDDEDY